MEANSWLGSARTACSLLHIGFGNPFQIKAKQK
jgi:hypothetical protein